MTTTTQYGRFAPRLAEVGRIRIGDAKGSGGDRRRRLENFRLTVDYDAKPVLEQAAAVYGGDVAEWLNPMLGRSWELYTTVNSLKVLVIPSLCVTSGCERWSASGLQRRCDGVTIGFDTDETKIGCPCECPQEHSERMLIETQRVALGKRRGDKDAERQLAALPILCEDKTRIQVLLPDLDIMATWRLETRSYYGSTNVIGQVEMLRMANISNPVEGLLSIQQTKVKRWDASQKKHVTRQFLVPTLRILMSPRQLLPQGRQPVPVPQLAAELYGGEDAMPVVSHTAVALPAPQSPAQGQVAHRAALMNRILASRQKAGLSQQEFTTRLHQVYEVSAVSDVHDLGVLEAIAGWADDGCPLLDETGADAASEQMELVPTPDEPHNDDIPL